MAEKKSGRGGAREGAGRPRELDENCKPRAIYCSMGEKQEMEKYLAFIRILRKYGVNPFAVNVDFGDLLSFMQAGTGKARVQLCQQIPEEAVNEMVEKIESVNKKVYKYQVRKKWS